MAEARTMLRRSSTGFCAAVLATLSFHQAMWGLLFLLGIMEYPFPLTRSSFGLPLIVDICLWRGAWGVAYAAVPRSLRARGWVSGLCFGLFVGACEWLYAFALYGEWPVSHERAVYLMQALLINGCWGSGLGLIFNALWKDA